MPGVNNVIIVENEEASLIKCIDRSIYYLSTVFVLCLKEWELSRHQEDIQRASTKQPSPLSSPRHKSRFIFSILHRLLVLVDNDLTATCF